MSNFLEDVGVLPPDGNPAGPISSHEARRMFVVWSLAGLALCLSYAPWSLAIQHLDAMFFFFTSERAAYGTPPHLSAFSPQNSLGVLVPALTIAAGRIIGADVVYAARIATIILYAVSLGLIAVLGLRLTGRRMGAVLAALIYLSLTPLAFSAAAGGQPKNVLTFFVILTLVLLERQRFGWAGASAMSCYLSYQPGVVVLLGVLLAALATPSPVRALRRSVIGALVPLIIFTAYLGVSGALGEALVQTHKFVAADPRAGGVNLRRAYLNWRLIWFGGFGRYNILPLVALSGCALLLVRVAVRPKAALAGLRKAPIWIALAVSGGGTAAYAVLDNGGVPDSYVGLTYLALFAALIMLAAVEWIFRGSPVGLRRMGFAVATVAILVVLVRTDRIQRRRAVDYDLKAQRAAAGEVGDMLRSGRSLYVLGYPYLLALNHVDNWSIYSSSHSVRARTGYWEFTHPGADFIPARNDSLPDLILWSRNRPQGWPAWIEANYRRVQSPALDQIGVRVWSKAGATGPIAAEN